MTYQAHPFTHFWAFRVEIAATGIPDWTLLDYIVTYPILMLTHTEQASRFIRRRRRFRGNIGLTQRLEVLVMLALQHIPLTLWLASLELTSTGQTPCAPRSIALCPIRLACFCFQWCRGIPWQQSFCAKAVCSRGQAVNDCTWDCNLKTQSVVAFEAYLHAQITYSVRLRLTRLSSRCWMEYHCRAGLPV